jgi:hypothetical protein
MSSITCVFNRISIFLSPALSSLLSLSSFISLSFSASAPRAHQAVLCATPVLLWGWTHAPALLLFLRCELPFTLLRVTLGVCARDRTLALHQVSNSILQMLLNHVASPTIFSQSFAIHDI